MIPTILIIVAVITAFLLTRKKVVANATTQEFNNVPTTGNLQPTAVEKAEFVTSPDTWVAAKLVEIQATGTTIPVVEAIAVQPEPATAVQIQELEIIKVAVIEESRAKLAPDTIDWQSVVDARIISAEETINPLIANNRTFSATQLQIAIDAKVSDEILAVVSRTNRTDFDLIQQQIDAGLI